jgi:hypothetical protein
VHPSFPRALSHTYLCSKRPSLHLQRTPRTGFTLVSCQVRGGGAYIRNLYRCNEEMPETLVLVFGWRLAQQVLVESSLSCVSLIPDPLAPTLQVWEMLGDTRLITSATPLSRVGQLLALARRPPAQLASFRASMQAALLQASGSAQEVAFWDGLDNEHVRGGSHAPMQVRYHT